MPYNYDKEAAKYSDTKGLKFKQNEKHLPQHPFRLWILGSGGSGKTNTAMSLIFDLGNEGTQINFTRIYLYAKDLTEDKYRMLVGKMKEREEKIRKKAEKQGLELPEDFFLIYAADNINDIIPVADLDKTEQNLIIFDDFINEKNQKVIQEYFTYGRKKNASMMYIAQSFRPTPKIVRDNSDYAALFKLNDKRDLNNLRNALAPDVEKKDFQNLYYDCVGDRKGEFLFIDSNQETLDKKFRCGFWKKTVW